MNAVIQALREEVARALQGEFSNVTILVLVFVTAAFLFIAIAMIVQPILETRRRVREQLFESGVRSDRDLLAAQERQRLMANAPIERYFERTEETDPNAIEVRLRHAGFYGKNAIAIFTVLRLVLCALAFVGAYFAAPLLIPSRFGQIYHFLFAALFGLGFMVVPGFVLDHLARRRRDVYRRGFPDFMDLMIVCAEAGMSLQSAVARVADEMTYTHRALGIHLKVMVLEMRAGRPLRDALTNLADRIGLEEAKTLAVLFKQSEELGASLTHALRVYADEMREKRITRAEEKANALPVKMLIPIGLFIFPVIMIVVMAPVIIRIRNVFF